MTSPTQLVAARRFGYGPAGAQPSDGAGILASLAGEDRMAALHPVPDLSQNLAIAGDYARLAKQRKQGAADDPDYRTLRRKLQLMPMRALVAGLARITASPSPFRERLAWFWADHFTVVAKKLDFRGLPGAFIDEAIRPHLAGRFQDMLFAAETHPAMMIYLDQARSIGPNSPDGLRSGRGLNENLAREALELHTLGAGSGYSQTDVTEFAKLLTGLSYDKKTGTRFRPRAAEPGSEEVLGVSYEGGLEDIRAALDDLALRPETARHLAHKLAVHFVADTPPEDMVAAMASAYLDSGGALTALYEALLAHPAALSEPYRKVRQPFEFIGAALRALAVVPVFPEAGAAAKPADAARLLQANLQALKAMGQPFLSAPGPNGWPEETDAWLSPQALAARIDWAMHMPVRLLDALPEPADFARNAVGANDEAVIRAAMRAETRQQGIGLVLASPAFNRR